MEFPRDETGQVLRRMFDSGMDLSAEHDIDFWHLFPDRTKATSMYDRVREMGFQAQVEESDDGEFDVRVVVRTVPTHAEITRIELQLGRIAAGAGGHADGWGVLQA